PAALRVRAVAAGAPVIQDVVVCGHDRAEIGLLVVPNETGCRSLCPDAPASMKLGRLLLDPRVRQRIAEALATMASEADSSCMRPARALLMHEPLTVDGNEITDKGYVNQRAVIARRTELVERLYAEPPDPEVIIAPQPVRGGKPAKVRTR